MIRGSALFESGYQEFGAGFSAGNADGLFGGADVGLGTVDGVDGTVTSFAAHFGGALTTNPGKTIEACPFVAFSYAKFPDVLSIDLSARQIAGGFAIGATVAASGSLALVPFGSIQYGQVSVSVSDGVDRATDSSTGGSFTIGVGLLSNKTLAFTPSATFPIGEDEGDPAFGVTVSFLLGRR